MAKCVETKFQEAQAAAAASACSLDAVEEGDGEYEDEANAGDEVEEVVDRAD